MLTDTTMDLLGNKKPITQAKKALLGLPKLRLLTCPGDGFWDRTRAVESIVDLQRDKWQCLHRQGTSVVYRRVIDP